MRIIVDSIAGMRADLAVMQPKGAVRLIGDGGKWVATDEAVPQSDFMPLADQDYHQSVIDSAIHRASGDSGAVTTLLRARMWPCLPAEDQVRECVPGSHGACPSTVPA